MNSFKRGQKPSSLSEFHKRVACKREPGQFSRVGSEHSKIRTFLSATCKKPTIASKVLCNFYVLVYVSLKVCESY